MRVVEALLWLRSMGEKKRATVKLIADYLRHSGSECFTYRGLRRFWDMRRMWRVLEWHTVERVVRELAQYGWLARRWSGRRVEFCVSENLEKMLRELGWL